MSSAVGCESRGLTQPSATAMNARPKRRPPAENASPLTLQARRRWTVTNMATSIGAVCRGYGFAWLPTDKIRAELAAGELLPLPLKGGRDRVEQLYLVFGDGESAGPGTRRLAEIIRARVAERCRLAPGNPRGPS